jgi:hypothetical protein
MAVTMVGLLSVGYQAEVSDPPVVTIILTGGTKLTREILSVRDSSIVVVENPGLSQTEILADPIAVAVLPYSGISSVQTVGNAHTILGFLIGMPIGSLGGCIIGAAQPDDSKGPINPRATGGGVQGCIVGGLAGAAAGYAWRTGSTVLISPGERNFQALKQVARYPLAEPVYLKSIAP